MILREKRCQEPFFFFCCGGTNRTFIDGFKGHCPIYPAKFILFCPELGDLDSNQDSHLQRVMSYH